MIATDEAMANSNNNQNSNKQLDQLQVDQHKTISERILSS